MRLGFNLEIGRGTEARASSPENPAMSLADPSSWGAILGWNKSAAGVSVDIPTALSVPAFWSGLNFLAGTIGSLPLKLYKRQANGERKRVTKGPLATLLAGTVNDNCLTSFQWRKGRMTATLLEGRGLTFVEKNLAGQVINLWPLETSRTTVKRRNGRVTYHYRDGDVVHVYDASEVIDVPFLLQPDGLSHYDPIARMKDTLGLAVALRRYSSRFFQNGGVPPLQLSGPAMSVPAVGRAKGQIEDSVKKANEDGSNVVYMPPGHELRPIGIEPGKSQLVEAQSFVILEIARFLGLPPMFLQDLEHGTFANTEQQDLHFVKHALTQWLEAWEQELNAKLFGPRNTTYFVEFDVDALLRGDFKTRIEGWARAIQSGQATPNEARRAENRPDMPGGDKLYIQGATVPIEKAGETPAGKPAAGDKDPNDDQN